MRKWQSGKPGRPPKEWINRRTYYVIESTGDDNNDGLSPIHSLKTLAAAILKCHGQYDNIWITQEEHWNDKQTNSR